MENEEDEVDNIEVVGENEELKVACSSDKRKGEDKDDDQGLNDRAVVDKPI